MRRAGLLLLGAVAIAAVCAPALAQCSMCKTALTNSSEGQRIAGEFNRAILLMVAAPYVVFGSIAGWLFRSRIRGWIVARVSQPESAPPSPSPSPSA